MYVCTSSCLPGEVVRPLFDCFFSSSWLVGSTKRVRRLCRSCVWIVPLFLLLCIMLQVKSPLLYGHRCYAPWRWDPSSLP
jgi:hypothetical protein